MNFVTRKAKIAFSIIIYKKISVLHIFQNTNIVQEDFSMKRKTIRIVAAGLFFVLFAFSNAGAESSHKKNLDGFWSIPWNVSAKEASKLMEKKNAELLSFQNDENSLKYSGTFGGKDAEITLFFIEDKFCIGTVKYPKDEDNFVSTYQTTKNNLMKKYGTASKESKISAALDDINSYGHNITSVLLGVMLTEGTLYANWVFEDKNFISLSADPSYSIKITYSNKKLLDEKSAKEEQEILEDF